MHRLSSQSRALIRPKIIVCLGRIAAQKIISPAFKVTKEHGQWFDKNGVQVMELTIRHPYCAIPRRSPPPLRFSEAADDPRNLRAAHAPGEGV
ncbi:MAG: hypothetical protein ACLSAP_08470 [Oscillospiraceae bacterium]